MIDQIISRAQILIQQNRFTDADKILKDGLTNNPDHVYILMLLAETNIQLDKMDDAERFADMGIANHPYFGSLFYLKSRIAYHKEKMDDAENYIQQAIALDVEAPDFYAFWANLKLTRKQFDKALELADKALSLDAENILGLNTRSTALLKLDRKEDSFKTIEGALREDPNNSFTHANYGWGLLEKGEHKKALEHFSEALKNNPTNKNARSGMAEALKASNLFYRLYLKYSFWIGNLTARYQWGVILGIYFGSKFLRYIAHTNPQLSPFLMPVVILLSILAFSTWIIKPIGNLFFRLNPYGKHLLSKKEILSSNFVGISAMVFVIGLLSYLIFNDDIYLAISYLGLSMMLPLGSMFAETTYKYVLLIYTTLLGLVGIAAVFVTFQTGELINTFSNIYLLGFLAFQFLSNYVNIKESNY